MRPAVHWLRLVHIVPRRHLPRLPPGTAISALSGVAASNATLAFFGGGSLAAGGLGMAGGAAVLGGLVAGPALLVMGVIIGAKGGKNLEEAKTQSAEGKQVL